ncbi:hypothetical protein N7G274_004090 [Stereocaulon virgatum]|uniref:Uncharacterized protein n=1 Tax=Stereocaulon virgatum TaxID=373712 RepID=A0ABR4AC35_9LECA
MELSHFLIFHALPQQGRKSQKTLSIKINALMNLKAFLHAHRADPPSSFHAFLSSPAMHIPFSTLSILIALTASTHASFADEIHGPFSYATRSFTASYNGTSAGLNIATYTQPNCTDPQPYEWNVTYGVALPVSVSGIILSRNLTSEEQLDVSVYAENNMSDACSFYLASVNGSTTSNDAPAQSGYCYNTMDGYGDPSTCLKLWHH